jgi:hypothetical protein
MYETYIHGLTPNFFVHVSSGRGLGYPETFTVFQEATLLVM